MARRGIRGAAAAWLDAAEFVDDKWERAAEQAAPVQRRVSRGCLAIPPATSRSARTRTSLSRGGCPRCRCAIGRARHDDRRVPHHSPAARSSRRRRLEIVKVPARPARHAGRTACSRRSTIARVRCWCRRCSSKPRKSCPASISSPRACAMSRRDAARRRVPSSQRRAVRPPRRSVCERVRHRRRLQILSARRGQLLPARAAGLASSTGLDRMVRRIRLARRGVQRRGDVRARGRLPSPVRRTIRPRIIEPPRFLIFTPRTASHRIVFERSAFTRSDFLRTRLPRWTSSRRSRTPRTSPPSIVQGFSRSARRRHPSWCVRCAWKPFLPTLAATSCGWVRRRI